MCTLYCTATTTFSFTDEPSFSTLLYIQLDQPGNWNGILKMPFLLLNDKSSVKALLYNNS